MNPGAASALILRFIRAIINRLERLKPPPFVCKQRGRLDYPLARIAHNDHRSRVCEDWRCHVPMKMYCVLGQSPPILNSSIRS